ncbi:hypothetical protein IHE45_08G062100 [Dioscorea alata]|uniref:Uncharacterized protein n=1 Tax=Dioscorea alata TaxID=55571 RepID=A0ACB7VJM0_DIOAL|nr:hypothetical protein IHE45_08G062100 [Dioscorea alata]
MNEKPDLVLDLFSGPDLFERISGRGSHVRLAGAATADGFLPDAGRDPVILRREGSGYLRGGAKRESPVPDLDILIDLAGGGGSHAPDALPRPFSSLLRRSSSRDFRPSIIS